MKKISDKNPKLLLAVFIAIISLLVIGIIYEFVCIKRLERQIVNSNQSCYEYTIGAEQRKILGHF